MSIIHLCFMVVVMVQLSQTENATSKSSSYTTTTRTTLTSTTDEEHDFMDNIGGIVGGIVGVLAILCIVATSCGAIILMKRQHRQQPARIQERGGPGWDISNAVYRGGDGYYAGIGPQVLTEINREITWENHEYSYADSEEKDAVGVSLPSLHSSPTSLKNLDEGKPSLPASKEEDKIYMIPASDENDLYAQLKDIMIKNLVRDSVKLGDLLGAGQFGRVFKGVLQSPEGEIDVAVKTLKEGSGEEDRVKFLQEATIMGQFKHPNVVTMHGVITDGKPILLVLELLMKGDLKGHLLHARSEEREMMGVDVDGHTLLSFCRQVASGMAYLSCKAFIHRDLAARNILVSENEICKIADFGMSRDLMDEDYYISHGGKIPVKWTAPEALHYKKYSSASDVWSYGVLMYEIWSVGRKPFEDYANNEVFKMIDTGFRLPPPPGCPRALYSIMISCWNPMSCERPNFQKILQDLSLPDTKLLRWSDEDKSIHLKAAQLGADLVCGQDLYKDLQTQYKAGNLDSSE